MNIFVKPKDGLKIRMPNDPTSFLPPEGQEVDKNSFWIRRINDGDVECPSFTKAEPLKTPDNKPVTLA